MKNLKKILIAMLIFGLVFILIPVDTFNMTARAENTASGTTAKCTWSLEKGVLTISGEGYTESYDYYGSVPWYNLRTHINQISIEPGVEGIGNYAFYGCTNLVSVTIPNGVKRIGNFAFYGCTSLERVSIPNSTKGLGSYAFAECTNLISANIPDGTISIGYAAFYNCISIPSVEIPNSVQDIGVSAFKNCSSITKVTIGNGLIYVGNSAFENCTNITGVYITDVAALCNAGFENVKANPLYYAQNLYLNNILVTDLVISNSVTNIGIHSFSGCKSITSATVSNSVTKIGYLAFGYCTNLKSITIPKEVVTIEQFAFLNCNLNSINFIGTHSEWNNSGYVEYEQFKNVTIICTCSGKHIYDNDDDVTCNACDYIKNHTPGDINDSGTAPDLDDVVALAQIIAGWQGVAHNEDALDVNGDTIVSLDDVVLLAQYVAGWNVEIK